MRADRAAAQALLDPLNCAGTAESERRSHRCAPGRGDAKAGAAQHTHTHKHRPLHGSRAETTPLPRHTPRSAALLLGPPLGPPRSLQRSRGAMRERHDAHEAVNHIWGTNTSDYAGARARAPCRARCV
eukprot:6584743-Pyramimonas_sp.AAC.2